MPILHRPAPLGDAGGRHRGRTRRRGRLRDLCRVTVPAQPTTPFIAIDAPGGAPGVLAVGRVENPIPTLVADHPLLDDLDIGRLAIAEAQVVEVGDGEVVLGAPGAPLIVAAEADGVPFYYIAFTLEQSNLPIDIAFPIIGARMVGGLATADGVAEPPDGGRRASRSAATGGSVTDPRGSDHSCVAWRLGAARRPGRVLARRPDRR